MNFAQVVLVGKDNFLTNKFADGSADVFWTARRRDAKIYCWKTYYVVVGLVRFGYE